MERLLRRLWNTSGTGREPGGLTPLTCHGVLESWVEEDLDKPFQYESAFNKRRCDQLFDMKIWMSSYCMATFLCLLSVRTC